MYYIVGFIFLTGKITIITELGNARIKGIIVNLYFAYLHS